MNEYDKIIQREEQTSEIYTPVINTTYQNKTWEGTFQNYTKHDEKYCTKTKILSQRDDDGEITGFITCSKVID